MKVDIDFEILKETKMSADDFLYLYLLYKKEYNYIPNLNIKQNLDKDPDYYILKYTGRPMTCTELYDTLKKIVNNNAEKREVLTYGA